MRRLGLSLKEVHLDTTSFHINGCYYSDERDAEGAIHIKQGYSRDHRPELNQVVLEFLVENQAGIPLLMKPLSGNQNDKTSFQEAVAQHALQPHETGIEVLVSDSAGYTATTLQSLQSSSITWVMSVPATLSQAKRLLDDVPTEHFSTLLAGYDVACLESNYADLPQRWF